MTRNSQLATRTNRVLYSKLVLSIIALFLGNIRLYAQYEYLSQVNQDLRHIFSQITYPDNNIMFLNERSAKLADSLLYQTNNPSTIHQMEWYQVYKEMYYASHDTLNHTSFNNLMTGVNSFGSDTITMGIMDWEFYRVKPIATTTPDYFIFDLTNNYFKDHPNPIASPYTVDNVFMASPLSQEANYLSVVYHINPNFIFRDNNTLQNYQGDYKLQINFGDGAGYRNINSFNQTFLNITYPTNGEKIIKTRVLRKETVIKSSSSRILVLNNYLPTQPDYVMQNIPGMTVGVFNSCQGASGKKVIYVEGFDLLDEIPSKNKGVAQIYTEGIEKEELHHLRNFGYEFYVVDWKESKLDMRFNALHLLCLIEHLKSISPDNQEFVIIGESMGGVIARYTLTFMESKDYLSLRFSPFFEEAYTDPFNIAFILQNPNFFTIWKNFVNLKLLDRTHNTRLLITVDSPHQGANLPLAYQHLYRTVTFPLSIIPGLSGLLSQVPYLSIATIFDKKAPRQLLKWYAQPSSALTSYSTYSPDPSHTSFFYQLNNFQNGGMPIYAKTIALSDGAIDGSRQQDPNTNAYRNFNDDILNFKFDSKVKILWIPFPFIGARARLNTNPNGTGQIFNASLGVSGYKLKLKFWSIKIVQHYTPVIGLTKIAGGVQPTCVTAGGYENFFNIPNFQGGVNPQLLGGFLGFQADVSIKSNGAGFCFVPLESALNYSGVAPFNNNILAANINDKLSRTPFDVIAGQVRIGVNPVTQSFAWKNHDHTANRNDKDYVFNLTQQSAINSNPNTTDKYAYHTCAYNKNFEPKRTFLAQEIGDEELYLENFTTNRKTLYRTEYDIKVNILNPYYEYPSQPPGSTPLIMSGIYSKENHFNVANPGFAEFFYDSSSPSPNPGFTMGYNIVNFNTKDSPYGICCAANARISTNEKSYTTLQANEKIDIYPNPVERFGHLHINSSNLDKSIIMTISTIEGKVVYEHQLNNITEAIPLQSLQLQPGVYLVRLQSANQLSTTKLIVN